jgi:hypothetical protein
MTKPYSRITVTLPTFLIVALRQLVKDANDKHPEHGEWSVSTLLQAWLFRVITQGELIKVAEQSREFKPAAVAWLRSLVKR